MNEQLPKRILNIVGIMNRGGIETQLMTIYRNIDKEKIQFDFLITRDQEGIFDEEIESLGGRIYRIKGAKEVGLLKFIYNIDKFFKSHNSYDIVHSHMNTWSGLFLGIAKRHGAKVRISHSHSAQQGHNFNKVNNKLERVLKLTMKQFIKINATHFWAVGQASGEWLFGKKIAMETMRIVPNVIDIDLYKFDEEYRESNRKRLGLDDESLLIGHVGNFSLVKNHQFLVDIFREIAQRNTNAYLCLVGDGLLRKDIELRVKEYGLTEQVFFLGTVDNVAELMSAFDILLLPSVYEGMPNVLVEAQASGLKCLVSNNVSSESDMNVELVNFISLNNREKWISLIENCDRNTERSCIINHLKEKYNKDDLVRSIENFYTNVEEREGN